MRTIHTIRIFILVITVYFSCLGISARTGRVYNFKSQDMPSDITYREIQRTYGQPTLRADGINEPELGGIDAPDPTISLKNGLMPVVIVSLGYIFIVYLRKKRRRGISI